MLVGLALGLLAVGADWLLEVRWFGSTGHGFVRAASRVLNAASVWASLGLLAGWLARVPARGALAGPLALSAGLVGYYLPYQVRAAVEDAPVSSSWWALVALWLAVAVLAGPLLGVVGALMRRPDLLGLLACAALPVGVVFDFVVRVGFAWSRFALEPVLTGAELAAMLLAGLLAVLAARARRGTRRARGTGGGARGPRSVFAQSEVTAVPEHVGWEQG